MSQHAAVLVQHDCEVSFAATETAAKVRTMRVDSTTFMIPRMIPPDR
jgi:hypothetical protein